MVEILNRRAVLLLLKSCCMADVDSTNSPSGQRNLFCYSLDPLSILFVGYAADVRFNHLLLPVSCFLKRRETRGKRNNRGRGKSTDQLNESSRLRRKLGRCCINIPFPFREVRRDIIRNVKKQCFNMVVDCNLKFWEIIQSGRSER